MSKSGYQIRLHVSGKIQVWLDYMSHADFDDF